MLYLISKPKKGIKIQIISHFWLAVYVILIVLIIGKIKKNLTYKKSLMHNGQTLLFFWKHQIWQNTS